MALMLTTRSVRSAISLKALAVWVSVCSSGWRSSETAWSNSSLAQDPHVPEHHLGAPM